MFFSGKASGLLVRKIATAKIKYCLGHATTRLERRAAVA